MSEPLYFEYALQEPATAIAPVFLVLPKHDRGKLDVNFQFGGALLNWRGPDALGIPEQSVLLVLMSAAKQQPYRLSASSTTREATTLRARLGETAAQADTALVIVKLSWSRLAAAVGYKSDGGKNLVLVRKAVKRLSETTIWEKRGEKTYSSRVLAWLEGDDDGVTIVLNRRATDTLCGGQFVKISLIERFSLPDDRSKALHAWLSGHLRQASSRVYTVSTLQAHVWEGSSSGSTMRSRICKLRSALQSINKLPGWECEILSKERVRVGRVSTRTIDNKSGDVQRQPGTFGNGNKTVKIFVKKASNSLEDSS